MGVRINREKIKLIIDWCQKEFGLSEHQPEVPKFRVYQSRGLSISKHGMAGCYLTDTNTICIFLGSNTSVLYLCKTIIHEYIHYTLSDDEYNEISKKMVDDGIKCSDIDTEHPHEKICRDTEEVCGNRCFAELKYKLYKK